MSSLLYYPRINAPRPVVYYAALYYDSLRTIVPLEHQASYDAQMMEAADLGLYKPFYVSQDRYEYSDTDRVMRHLDTLLDTVDPAELFPPPAGSTEEIYLYPGKVPPEVIQKVLEMDLATWEKRKDSTTYPYEYVPGRFSKRAYGRNRGRLRLSPLLQTFLISYTVLDVTFRDRDDTGHLSRESLFPHTDQPAAYLATHIARGVNSEPCWKIDVGKLLPVPQGEVLLSDLIKFRERYDDERKQLLLALDMLVHNLRRYYDHPADVVRMVQGELAEATAAYNAATKSTNMTWKTRSLSLTAAVIAGYSTAKLSVDAAWVAALASALGVNIATGTTRARSPYSNDRYAYFLRVQEAL